MKTSQQLKTLGGNWEAGPALFGERYDSSQCLVQVKTNVDVLFD